MFKEFSDDYQFQPERPRPRDVFASTYPAELLEWSKRTGRGLNPATLQGVHTITVMETGITYHIDPNRPRYF